MTEWTNTGTDKQEEADSLLHATTSHTHVYTNFHNPSYHLS